MSGGIGLSAPGTTANAAAQSYSGAVAGSVLPSETFPRWAITAGVTPVAGVVYGTRIHLVPGAYTSLSIWKGGTVGNTFANCYVAVHDTTASANRLAVSAESAAIFEAAAASTVVTISLAYTVTVEADYFISYLIGSAAAICNLNAPSAIGTNALGSTAPAMFLSSGAAQTTIPTTLSFGTVNRAVYARYS